MKDWRDYLHHARGSFGLKELSIMTFLLGIAFVLQVAGYLLFQRSLRLKLQSTGITAMKWGVPRFLRWQDITSISPGIAAVLVRSKDSMIRLRWAYYRDEDWPQITDIIETAVPKDVDSTAVVRWIRNGIVNKAKFKAGK